MRRALYAIGLCAVSLTSVAGANDIDELRRQISEQRAVIEELQKRIDAQGALLERLAAASGPVGAVPETAPPRPRPAAAAEAAKPSTASGVSAGRPPAVEDARSVNGFRFSGDFRYRLDAQLRSGNQYAAPLQNVRGRYRLRLNVDKQIDPKFRFHAQLSTGPLNNPLTNDQDMAGLTAKHPFSISEAFVEYRPSSSITLRGGRTEDVFADNMRFLWDDDVRFNGFTQSVRLPLKRAVLGFDSLELRAAEFLLSNPAVYILSPSSPYVAAGYEAGSKVRSAALFHPGAVLRGSPGAGWSHQVTGGVEFYRNPGQIQLASTAAGFPVLVSGAIGVALSGAVGGTGNATTSPGGAVYSAPNYRNSHLGYRLERQAVRIGGREAPLWFDFQAARNHGARTLRDAFMASANLGAVRRAGDVRLLYQFAIKDANSMISQFTDDDLGTGSGVNIAAHAARVDIGLTSFLQWQNLVFFQRQRRASNPDELFFVPLGRGANQTTRFLSQLAFTF